MPEREPEMVFLTDEEGAETPFVLLARLQLHGRQYAILQEDVDDADDEDVGVMVFCVTEEADGSESFAFVEDDDESDDVFYYWQADTEDYEFMDAV